MVIVYDAAVRTDRNVYACLFIIFISCLSHFDNCGSLSTSDTLLFSRDTDRTASNTDFDKVSTCICQVFETFFIYNISCTDLYTVAVLFSYEIKGQLLPFCKAFGGVDAKHICTGLYESRDTFCVVSGVDTGAYDITLVFIQQFVRISLMGIVVLTEYEMSQSLFLIYNRKCIELVVPENVVCFRKGHSFLRINQFIKRSHEIAYFFIKRHTADTIVSAGHQTEHLAVRCAVFCNSSCRMACPLLQFQQFSQCLIRANVGIACYESRLVSLDFSHHFCLILNAL